MNGRQLSSLIFGKDIMARSNAEVAEFRKRSGLISGITGERCSDGKGEQEGSWISDEVFARFSIR